MDLIVLADKAGQVDMTLESIARRTNIPKELISEAIQKLCQPDLESRSKEQGGRRLIPIDPERSWGWVIVNYAMYRGIRDENEKREYHRAYMAKWREEHKSCEGSEESVNGCETCEGLLNPVNSREGSEEMLSPHTQREREREDMSAAKNRQTAPQIYENLVSILGARNEKVIRYYLSQAMGPTLRQKFIDGSEPPPDTKRIREDILPELIDLATRVKIVYRMQEVPVVSHEVLLQTMFAAALHAKTLFEDNNLLKTDLQLGVYRPIPEGWRPQENDSLTEPQFKTRAARLKYEAGLHTSRFDLDSLNEWAKKHHNVDDIEKLSEKQIDELLRHLGLVA